MRPITESYEQLQNSVENNDARAAWKYADARSRDLVESYRALKDDPRYTPEHKAEQAWAAYEKTGHQIKTSKEKARELLEKEATYNEEMSIPRPRGESLKVGSAERLLAGLGEDDPWVLRRWTPRGR